MAMLTFKLTESQDYESYLLLIVDSDQRGRLGNSAGHLHCRFLQGGW